MLTQVCERRVEQSRLSDAWLARDRESLADAEPGRRQQPGG